MKNKGTLLLAGAVLALGLYAYFGEYKREIRETERKQTESKIITLNRDQIQKIIFDKGLPNPITLERGADGWSLVLPAQDQADNDVVEAFLDQIMGEKSSASVGEGAQIKWSEYGLDQPMGSVILETNSGAKQIVTVSMKKNFEGLPFLRRDEESRILVGNLVWIDFLTKSVDHFRNLKVFRNQISKVDLIKVRNAQGEFELKNKEAQWVSSSHSQWKLDQNAVREILTQLSLAKGKTLLETKPNATPIMTVELGMEQDRWKGQFYKESVMIQPLNLHISLELQALDNLKTTDLLKLRDRTVPFKFDRDSVTRIKVKNPLKNYVLLKKNNNWELEKADKNFIVNQEKAQDLPERLHRLEVYKYVKTPPKSISNLSSHVELLSDDGKVILKLSWSDFKDHEAWATTNIVDETFQIDDAQINRLGLNEIVKAHEKTTESADANATPEEKP